MDPLWYWQSKQRVYGPLTTKELEAVVRQGKVSNSDLIRLDGSAEWIAGVEIRQMFGDTGGTTSKAAADLLSNVARRRLQASVCASSGRTGVMRRCSAHLHGLGKLANGLGETIVDGLKWTWAGRNSGWGRCALIVILVLITSMMMTPMESWFVGDRSILDRLVATWDEFQQLDAAASSKRGPFVSQKRPWLLSTIESLEKLSLNRPIVSDNWLGSSREMALARREMLFACRGIDDAFRAGVLSEFQRSQITESLDLAHKYLRAETEMPPNLDGRHTVEPSGPLFYGVLAIDSIVLVAGTAWWARRRFAG